MNVDSNGSDTRCHFLALPPELRLSIYDSYYEERSLAIRCDGEVQLSWTYAPENDERSEGGKATALLWTCRTVSEEAQPVLLGNTRMVVYAFDLWDSRGHWQSFGSIENCSFLKSFLSARSWDIRCYPEQRRHSCTELKWTAELLESLDWLKGVKELVIRLGQCWAFPPGRDILEEALECLQSIECEGAITLVETEVELKEQYEEIVRALGASKVPLPPPGESSDSDNGDREDDSVDEE
ncbi:hypothetical protein LTR37_014002 [Vermiconidia calcicola]|uniref:Uncharacterized protein n=1 Tax=Vermiconidia calcicola TaxID=1690605 RepID=A0ACC3MWB5_9PEZI|nr:hypothetical protein LTR37_014002 [Vermiconidia calcicola]